MDSSVQRVTLGDVERRFLAGKSWWATRIGIMFLGAAFAFVLALMVEGMLAAVVGSVMASVLVPLLVFREDHIFFGHAYKVGGRYESGRGAQSWVEQSGTRPAHDGAVIVVVHAAGMFSWRRFIIVSDSSDHDSPFGRHMEMSADGYFAVARRRSGTARARHIEGMMTLLIEDTRPLHRGPATVL